MPLSENCHSEDPEYSGDEEPIGTCTTLIKSPFGNKQEVGSEEPESNCKWSIGSSYLLFAQCKQVPLHFVFRDDSFYLQSFYSELRNVPIFPDIYTP